MKTSTLIFGGLVLGVGVYLAYKYKGQIASTVNPDPTVTTLAGSTYQGSEDVPGPIYDAAGAPANLGTYNPLTSSPGANAALNGAIYSTGSGLGAMGALDA